MNFEKVITRLKKGNERFVSDELEHTNQDASSRKNLTGGQEPYAIILSCADSRVVPELMFDTGLGELFVVRVAGNIANTESLASVEYAVAHCGSKVIVVMGHESCGAVTAAKAGGDNGPNINALLDQIKPAVDKAGKDADVNEIVKLNAQLTSQDLLSKSKILQDAVEKEGLKIIPAYYNLGTGKVDFL